MITGRGGSPCTMSLKTTLRDKHFSQYVEERDDRHHPANPSYADASNRHAALVWKLPSLSVPARARAVRIMFNKLWMPWTIARYEVEGEVGSDGRCPVCSEDDSPRHLICHCTDPLARQIRADGERALQRVEHDSPSDPGVEELIDTLRAMRSDGSCWSIWTGM